MKRETVNKVGLAFAVGFTVEFILHFLKVWTYPNLQYYFGVPIAIVIVWTLLLSASNLFIHFWKIKSFLSRTLFFIIGIWVAEWIGSNLLHWKLSVANQYPQLMPGCCNAPLWLYFVYYGSAMFYWYYLDKVLNK